MVMFKNKPKKTKNKKRAVTALLLFSMLCSFAFAPGFLSDAQAAETVVRVGWYESPFNQTDSFGRRSGYAYEYQQKIAALTGWKYEYVTGSWSDLLEMLSEGKIDLLSDVSYTEERSKHMLYSSLPMGAEEYDIYVAPGNDEITPEDLSTLNGKKVAINKGSIQVGFFKDWANANGVNAQVVEISCEVSEGLSKLQRGDFDAYVSIDGYFATNEAIPIVKVGSSDFYFAVSDSRPELVEPLNTALNRIQTENPYYHEKLSSKYIKVPGANFLLSVEEKSWLEDRKTIKVGYQDNYLAFCAKDPKTNELTGALKEYLRVAADCFENAHIGFETIAYPTASDAMEALKNGEIDCMFPANLTDYDGEMQGIIMTDPFMRTDISAIVLDSVHDSFLKKEHITVAVNAGNPNYNMFLVDNFPAWRPIIFDNTKECLKAISKGKADCLLISNYRYNNISKLCKKYGLVSVSTGVEMDYCFAVRRDNGILYSILNKITAAVPDSTVDAALSYYFTEDAKLTFIDIIQQNIVIVLAMFGMTTLLLFILLTYNIRARKKATASEKLITATQTDPFTGLYSKNYFYEYAAQMYGDDPKTPMDVIVLNIEQFHSVNAIHGWEFGDNILRALAHAIASFVEEHGGIACHSEADRFGIYCPHIGNYNALFDRLQNELNEFAPNAGIWLRMGVMPWEEGLAPRQQIEQALIACSLARGRYNEHVVIFDARARERENYEQLLKNDLSRAVKNREFKVYYQPKYDIRPDPPVVTGAEALVRWQHPDLGMIPPNDFIPLFERNGQIGVVDRYVCQEVISQIARWKKEYGVVMPVSVNLSRIDVYDPQLEELLDRLLKDNGLDHAALRIEVTESAYTENTDQLVGAINRLNEKGYKIEMDDFGTGYSSLTLLSSLPIDYLKMDRAFIKNIGRKEADTQLIKVILDIAKTLKIPVTAEGVETEEQLRQLKELGCETVQGFYFSPPLPTDKFENEYLKKEK